MFFFCLCIKSTRVGPILLRSAAYRKQGYYFVWPKNEYYTQIYYGSEASLSFICILFFKCIYLGIIYT